MTDSLVKKYLDGLEKGQMCFFDYIPREILNGNVRREEVLESLRKGLELEIPVLRETVKGTRENYLRKRKMGYEWYQLQHESEECEWAIRCYQEAQIVLRGISKEALIIRFRGNII